MKEAPIHETLLARLGYAVFEDAGGGALAPVGPPPEWFLRAFGAEAAAGGRFVPADASPFLENFLAEAERVWAGDGTDRAESGAWIERGADGVELALEAEALVLQGRRILFVVNQQQRFDETSRMLQIARVDKLAHERLLREIQTKEILLHCIVHDLSQPLTAVRGCLSLLTMGLPPDKFKEVVEIADRQTHRQEEMIRDVLKAFSSEMAELQAAAAGSGHTVDLAQGAREVVSEYSAAFASQGAALALHPRLEAQPGAGGEWRAAGEPERLRRMFTNYLENALRYSPAGTVVTVGVEEDGAFLRAFVDDQGPGLPEGVTAANLFRLFGKGKGSTGKAGLGLYFCKITAERWGGSVGCRNRAEGGTRFWFSLPRAHGAATQAMPHEDAAALLQSPDGPAGGTRTAERRLRILLADDIEMNRRVATELLVRRGHEVVAVGNGRAAVAAARESTFDIALLDVQMPGMDGLEAARAIRAGELAQGRKLAILAFTANDLPEDREQIRLAGMDGHVVKPFDRETLYRAVESAAGSGPAPSAERSAAAEIEAGAVAESAPPPPALTGESIVARFGGDARLAAQLARMFLKDSPRLLGAVRRAAAHGAGLELARTAHALKGAVGHFGAQAARQAAARLEEMGKHDERNGMRETLAELSVAVEALRQELSRLAGGKRAGAPAGAKERKSAGAKTRRKRRAG